MKNSVLLASLLLAASAWAQAPQGEIKGDALVHTAASAQDVIAGAQVALPASVTGGAPYLGPLRGAPKEARQRVPVVVFMHGSSGLALKAIGEWQQWLAAQGIASLAPDSFALPGHVTYKSPIDKASYERIHALRSSEIALALRRWSTRRGPTAPRWCSPARARAVPRWRAGSGASSPRRSSIRGAARTTTSWPPTARASHPRSRCST